MLSADPAISPAEGTFGFGIPTLSSGLLIRFPVPELLMTGRASTLGGVKLHIFYICLSTRKWNMPLILTCGHLQIIIEDGADWVG